MEYKYCLKENFEDFACGRVIYHKTGMPNFPVRLAQEIFYRSLNYLESKENVKIYDPCCGGGYLLTVLGLLNLNLINEIYGSDISQDVLDLASSNISLLTETGLEKRINQLKDMVERFNKDSHKEAIESANKIMNIVNKSTNKPKITLFQADVLDEDLFINTKNNMFKVDIIITDVPYGNLVNWQGENDDYVNIMLNNLIPVLKPNSIIAICSDKKQKIKHDKYKRLEKQIVGKRKFEILTLNVSVK